MHAKIPLLAPIDFKPLHKHIRYCKICYDNKIDMILMPCRHRLFCFDCAELVGKVCPLDGRGIVEFVKLYKLKKFVKEVQQL